MGKPAARLGDSTAHGGVIVAGAPTVLICGMPAARLGDMTTCPMAVPAPTPIPHVGGPITLGSAGVLICGMPAARMGDQALCPPMGPAPIVVGAPTVLIGETGGGGGGGGGGGAAGSGGGTGESQGGEGDGGSGSSGSGSGSSAAPGEAESEGHFVRVNLVDKGGHPITGVRYDLTGPEGTAQRGWATGGIKATGVPEGDYKVVLSAITFAGWSSESPKVGEEIKLQVETAGIEAGTHAKLEIFLEDTNRPLVLQHTIETSVDGDKIEEPWTFEVDDAYAAQQEETLQRAGYSNPFHVFKVTIGSASMLSTPIQFRDELDLTITDDEGNAMKDRELRLIFANGEIRPTKSDSSGNVKETDVPPGLFRVSADVRGND